jgi:diguanylate cyclase (GGDEF)-like protein/PAS domain S-box-containing protein
MQAVNPDLGELTTSSRANRLEWLLQRVLEMQALINEADFNVDRFMQEVVDLVERLTDARGAVVELVDGADLVYRCASASIQHHVGLRLARRGSLSGLCVAQARVLRCDDSEEDPRTDVAACRKVGVRSMICAPLLQLGRPIGVLKVLSGEAHAFDSSDEHLLRLLAASLGTALGNQIALDASQRAEARLRESEAHLRAHLARTQTLVANASDAVAILNGDGRVMEWNAAAERQFGWSSTEAAGQDFAELVVAAADRDSLRSRLQQFGLAGSTPPVQWRLEFSAVPKGSETRLNVECSFSAVSIAGQWQFVAFLRNVTDRKHAEAQLEDLAMKDGLTGLSNRRRFMSYCERALARAKRSHQSVALFYMDLNRFKEINDQYGHEAGDLVLKEFAKRILHSVRLEDEIARLGGDEFVLLAEGISTDAQAQALIAKLQQALAQPMRRPPVQLEASMGYALYHDQPNALALLREADQAMYVAKRQVASDCVPGGFL